MKNIVLKTALVFALGVAPGALAQNEMLKKKPAQQTEGQTRMPEKDTPEQGAATKPPTDDQGGAAKPQTEDQAGTQIKKNQQTDGQAQAPAEPGTDQQDGATKQQSQEQTGTTTTEDTAKTNKAEPSDDPSKTQVQPSTETTGSVKVTTEQQTEIKQVITETKAEPVRDVNFEMNVGTRIPQAVELHPLPPRIVKIVPRYEGYRYFLLADGRIIIVDPDSLEIVLIIV